MEHPGLPSVIVVVLGLLGNFVEGLTPRVSFPIGAPGRSLSHFNSSDVRNTTTLLLSDDGDTLYIGARDFILSLNVSQKDITVIGKLDWSPSEKDMYDCSMKGKKKADCHNFVRVLQFLNSTHMYACGTFAFSPRCTYIKSEPFSLVTSPTGKPEEGRGRCPYDPYQRNSAISVDGELYTGTVADYMGNRPVISRHLGEGSHVDLKLDDTVGWLEDPTFISSSFVPSEEKIYFFFSEVGREYDFVEKFTVSRIAQVCTSDIGGQRTLQKRWTTFTKAQLLCKSDNEIPYNVLQDIVTLPPPDGTSVDDTLFFGIFGSQWSVNTGKSVVCAFRLGDIKDVFRGHYKVLNRDTGRWSPRPQERPANPGECGLHNASDNILRFVKENFLAEESVRPVERRLTLVSPDQRYALMAAQRVTASNHKLYTVLFLLTETGYLHKAVLLDDGDAHIVEEIQVFEQPQPIKSVLLSVSKGEVFVGSSEGVVKVPVSNCSYYGSCSECVLARDPYCAWDHTHKVCAAIDGIQDVAGQDVEGGNVQRECVSAIMPRSRPGPAKGNAAKLLLVSLGKVVRLQCPEVSRLARSRWEGLDLYLDPNVYQTQDDNSLNFLSTAATQGQYSCISTENNFQQTLAVYQVKLESHPTQQTTPTSEAPTKALASTTRGNLRGRPTFPPAPTSATVRQVSANFTRRVAPSAGSEETGVTEADSPGGEALPVEQGKTYLKELVVVSMLLAACVTFLITIGLYNARQRFRNKTVPQDVSQERDAEQEPLRDDQSPCGNGKRSDPTAPNGQANGVACNGTPKASNGHLPNTPT
ncbi:hypothetical protein DPEC_G00202600 [Dallia pectoralis]|uniref:Uncharacterized protein n=1 Tax=Dallia pectoralis TaxID=75939 RepID=A0ACC2G9E8_DALPE|nr:hypothetical protein DPEC_G00202600 [Dallia pectoralis]